MFTDNIPQEIAIGTLWSFAIALSLIGWGSLLTTLFKVTKNEWVKGVLGLGVFIVLSSLLDYLSLANRENLVYMFLIGFAIWAVNKGPKNLWDLTKDAGINGLLLLLVTLYIAILGSNTWLYDSNWDDSSGYYPVCHEMSVSGQSWAPLSLRRILSWGGQYPLQTLGMLFTMDMGGYIYDRSVGGWIVLLLALTTFKGQKPSAWTPLAGVGILLLPHTALNSAPTVISALLFLGMYIERKNIVFCAIFMAATALTRSQLIVPSIMVGLLTIYEIWRYQKNSKELVRYALLTPTITAILCIPAMLLHKEMYNTVTVFLSSGTLDKSYITFTNYLQNLTTNLWDTLITCSPNLAVLFGCIGINAGRKISIIAFLTLLFMVVSMPEYSWIEFRRYSWPVIAAALWIAVLQGWSPRKKAILTIMLLASSTYALGTLTTYHKKAGQAIKAITNNEYPWYEVPRAQKLVPEGSPIIYLGSQPALLDYTRNKIVNWDSFPAVGNPPSTNDPQLWRKWASKFGANYLIHIDFEATYPNGTTVEDLWISPHVVGGGILPHYTRVWFPDRKKNIPILKSLTEVFPYAKSNRHVIIDLRPENSPYELSIPKEEIERIKKYEKEDKEFLNKYNELKRNMEEDKLKQNQIREKIEKEKKASEQYQNPKNKN